MVNKKAPVIVLKCPQCGQEIVVTAEAMAWCAGKDRQHRIVRMFNTETRKENDA